jgi:two-component system CheB/CheR fusion protein
LVLLSFEHARPTSERDPAEAESRPPDRVIELERELQYTKESHQGTIEELETANEELKSTNEELQSTNEELQSANEELETSKEEMQSLNEELQTVNAELQGKVDELSRANNDMKNLLNGTDIATIFLDGNLQIKRYTDQAKKVIRLIPTDVGRSIGDLVSTLRYDRLVDDAREVLRTLVFKETEVRGEHGEWYLMRILPYRTTENLIDGIVLTFVDITKVKTLQAEQERLLEALEHSPVGVYAQDLDFRFTWACSSVFGKTAAEITGRRDLDLLSPQDADKLRDIVREVTSSTKPKRQQLALEVARKPRSYDLYVEPRRDRAGKVVGVTSVVTDLTPQSP